MDGISGFREAITPFLPTWKGIDVKAIVDEETNRLLSLVACLLPELPTYSKVWPSTRGVKFLREPYGISALAGILGGLEQGIITIKGCQYSTAEFPPQSAQCAGIEAGECESDVFPPDDLTLGWPDLCRFRRFCLRSSATHRLEEIVQPRTLHSISEPWGANTFSKFSLRRVQFPVGDSYSPRVELYAPVLVAIDSRVQTGGLAVKATSHRDLPTDELAVQCSVRDYRGVDLVDVGCPLSTLQPTTSGYLSTFEQRVALPEQSASGEAHVFYKRYRDGLEPIASKSFGVPVGNPPWDLLLSVVAQTRVLSKAGTPPSDSVRQWLGLAKEKPKGPEFERGVAVLFYAAGAGVLSIGELEGIDHLVSADDQGRAMALVSCTTAGDVGKKIGPIVTQCRQALRELHDGSVNAVIFAPVDLVGPDDRTECEHHGVTLMLRPEIQTLFDLISAGKRDRAMHLLRQKVFRSGSEP